MSNPDTFTWRADPVQLRTDSQLSVKTVRDVTIHIVLRHKYVQGRGRPEFGQRSARVLNE